MQNWTQGRADNGHPKLSRSTTLIDHFRDVLLAHPEAVTYRYDDGDGGEPTRLTNAELDQRARAIAEALRARVSPGDRALIISPPGFDYIASFFGCLYAGVIAVPVYPPEPPYLKRALPRLAGVVEDAQPSIVLAPASVVGVAARFSEFSQTLGGLPWLEVDTVPVDAANHWQHPPLAPDDVAFLQYTSGSTSQPKGVMVTLANLLHNLEATHESFFGREEEPDRNMVMWLPPYHDMGLIGGLLQPAYAAFPVTVMSPMAFLKRPDRWLRLISTYRATVSGGPNFAYELCVQKFRPELYTGLDLSSWSLAFNGAEPVRARTIDRFTETFAPYGFRREAFYPCYGLAEGTLMASGADRSREPVVRTFDSNGTAQDVGGLTGGRAAARTLVSSGRCVPGNRIVVVDPERRAVVDDGTVGEIWLDGPSVAAGYWRAEAATEAAFHATLADGDGARYLRTGDLGFLDGGELFVTGRSKDLIIVAGRNYYPQDLEGTVEQCHPSLRPGCGVVCTVTVDGESRLLVAQEVLGAPGQAQAEEIVAAVRQAVASDHDLQTHEIVLLRRGGVPKTSSGKLQRSKCAEMFLAETLNSLHAWSITGNPAHGAPDVHSVPATSSAPDTPFAVDGSSARAAAESLEAPLGRPGAAAVRQWLMERVAERAHLPLDSIDTQAPFVSFGLGSMDMVGVVGDLELWLSQAIPATLPWEFPTIDAASNHLGATGPGSSSTIMTTVPAQGAERAVRADEPVAIIGIGCRLPGGGNGPRSFWTLLENRQDAISEVPGDRWDVDDFFDDDPATPGKSATRWGGFLDQVDEFDPQFFGISPREAAQMDPQQRLLAEVTWEAVDDAGLRGEQLAGSSTGVFIGISTSDYAHLALNDLTKIDAFTGTGNALSIAANRLSYLFDLRGPSMALDTACSSSLVAVYQACRSLAQGDCSVAIAGGVNVILSPALAINFSKAGAMAPDGRCKAFDSRADGYVRGEGAGVVVLKPLRRALADGDRIYATIRGGAVNQDGRTNGLMAPNPQSQEAVLRAAYAHAGVNPAAVGYVEAHGTGTLLGDPIEAQALASVMGAGRDPSEPLVIGSVKSNIGHLEAAAGIAGLIKAALVLHHRHIPASLHYEQANPHIPFHDLPVRVADSAMPWPDRDVPAIAGVSAFGFGGTNAHLVLEEAPRVHYSDAPSGHSPHLLAVSARSDASLLSLAGRYLDRLGELDAPSDAEAICRTAALRRTHHERRLVCVGDSAAQLREQLAAFVAGEERPGLHRTAQRVGSTRDVVFAFAGQGPRWWPLSRELIASEPVFRSVLERSEAWLRQRVSWSLLEQLTMDPAATMLAQTSVGQPALCAVQMALAELWRARGVEPTVVVGHSVGEIAAACVSGALVLEDALRVALHRGQVIEEAVGRGGMAVVGLTFDQAQRALARSGVAEVWVSASNGPTSTVLSGELASLTRVVQMLQAEGLFCRLLDKVHFASHCPQMDPLLGRFRDALVGLSPSPTSIPMISSVTAAAVEGTTLDAAYWATNLRSPVLFDQAITALVEAGQQTFVEISAHPMLASAIEERLDLSARPGVVVTSVDPDEPGPQAMLESLGRLHCAGYPVDWRHQFDTGGRVVDLPAYEWQRQRSWIDGDARRTRVSTTGHPMLETVVRSAIGAQTVHWTGQVDSTQFPYLADHCVAGTAVLPASTILELATAGARRLLDEPDVTLTGVTFTRMTPVDARTDEVNLQLVLQPENASEGTFQVFTSAVPGGGLTEAAHGRFELGAAEVASSTLSEARARCTETMDVAEHYAQLSDARLQYGPAFRAISQLWRGTGEAVAELRAPGQVRGDRGRYVIHPALLDSCLQVLAAALTDETGGATYLPVAVERCTLRGARVDPYWARAEVDAGSSANDDIVGARVTLYAEDGSEVGQLDGIRLHRLDTCDGAPGPDPVLELTWHEISSPAADAVTAGSGWWLLFADRERLCEQLRAKLAGHVVVTVTADDRFARLDSTHFTVDARSAQSLADLLAELARAFPETCLGAIHAWSLDAVVPDDDAGTELVAARDLSCLSVLHLVQGLTGAAAEPRPRLVLVTRGAQVLGTEAEAPAVAQAPLWGLARVILLEHGELRPTIIDLDPAGDEADGDEAGELVAELLAGSGGQQLALRGGRWFTPRLTSWRGAELGDEWPTRRFDTTRDTNERILALRPGALDSVAPTLWHRTPPGPHEVEIKVEAAGLNFSDVLKAMDSCPGVPSGRVPLGAECAGRVVTVGSEVTRFRVGDVVMAVAPSSMSAFATAPDALVAHVPQGLTVGEGAALPIAFLTAMYGLEYLAHLSPGDSVLIHSATGGVGMAALQIARRNGAQVFATAGTEQKRDLLRTMGVEHVMDSRSLRFADEVLRLTGGRGVDVVLNSLAGQAQTRSLSVLAKSGRFVEIGKQDVYANSHLGLLALRQNRSFFAVDLESMFADLPQLITTLLEQLADGFRVGELQALPVTEFGYSDAVDAFTHVARARHTGKVVLRPDGHDRVSVSPDEPTVRSDSTYLVTGGLGDLGRHAARYLVDQGARHLVLVGRGAPSAPAARALDLMRLEGAQVEVRAVDVSQAHQVDALLAEVDETMPRLAGVVHAAGALDDGMLLQLDRARFDSVWDAKATGAWHLHRATRDRQLDFFVLYSSAAGLLGSPGQGNYAAANAFLDALALSRRQAGLPGLSINWGPWSEIGLAARGDRDAALAGHGIAGVTSQGGAEALHRVLRFHGQVSVLPIDPDRLGATARSGLLPDMLADLAAGDAQPDDAAGAADLRARMLAIEPGRRRRAVLTEHCTGEVARVLRIDPVRVALDAPLAGMGFDSLMSLELRKRLESSLGVPLPTTLAWRFPTVEAMVPFLGERMAIALDPVTAPDSVPSQRLATLASSQRRAEPADKVLLVPAIGSPDGAELDGELAEMSADELEALLTSTIAEVSDSAQHGPSPLARGIGGHDDTGA